MILTCPACSAKYKLADTAIPAQGRKVRCAACGHQWHQDCEAKGGVSASKTAAPQVAPEASLKAAASPGDDVVLERRGKKDRRKFSWRVFLPKKDQAAGPDKLKGERRKTDRRKEPPTVAVAARNKVQGRIRAINTGAAIAAWVISLGAVAGLAFAGIHNRASVVKAWPQSATLFASIGLPANLYGIDIARVQVRDGVDGRGQRIVVAGVLRGVGTGTVAVPYLKVELRDSQGQEKASWLVDPGVTSLRPGQVHAFETQRRNPPRGQLTAVVAFAEPPLAAPRPAPPPPEPPTGKTGLMGAMAPAAEGAKGEAAAPKAETKHEASEPHAPAAVAR